MKKLPRHFISQFMEMNPINALALDVLKDKIKERFEAKGQVVAYSTEVHPVNLDADSVLRNLTRVDIIR